MTIFYEDNRFRYSISGWTAKRHLVFDKAMRVTSEARLIDVEKLGQMFAAIEVANALHPMNLRRAEANTYRAFCFTVSQADDDLAQTFIRHDAAVAALIFGTM